MKKQLEVIEEATVESEFSWSNEKVSEEETIQLEDEVIPKRKREVKEDQKSAVKIMWKEFEIKQLTECQKNYGNDYEEL